MKTKSIILVGVIILLLIVPVFWILLQDSSNPQNESNEPAPILWQRNIENFATGLATDGGNVYTIDIFGNIKSYYTSSGNSVWNGSIGGYFSKGVLSYKDKVYGGSGNAIVGCLDKTTGRKLWDLAGTRGIKYGKQAPENFTVVDDRLFIKTNTFSVFNAMTGKFLWMINEFGPIPGQSNNIYGINAWAFDDDLIIATSGSPEGKYIYRLNPDHGTINWTVDGMFSGTPVIYQGQAILQNQTGQNIFSLNVTSGEILWSFDIEAEIFSSIEYNGLLLFVASNDCFYALNLDTVTLEWKTNVASQNITSLVNSDNPLEALPIIIDEQNQRMIGCLAVTTQTTVDDIHVEDHHYGILCSLDIETGNIVWTEYFSGDGNISNKYLVFDYASSENYIYMTAINDLLIFSKKTGNLIEAKHYEHQVTPPVAGNGKVYVAADLWLFAYD